MSDYSWIPAVVGGVMGDRAASGMDAKQQELLERIYDDLRNIPLPELEKLRAEQLGPTAMEGVHTDPALRQNQLETLAELQDIYNSGGLDIEDRAALNEGLNRANVAGSAQRKMLEGEYAQRGQLGSGARLALGNMNAQGAANRANQTGLDVGAMASRRRMDALKGISEMSSGMHRQDFGEASERARAADAASRWNADARQNAGRYNAGLNQQQFNNQVSRATGATGAGNNLSNLFGTRAANTRTRYDAYGRAIAEAMKDDGDNE